MYLFISNYNKVFNCLIEATINTILKIKHRKMPIFKD